MLRDLIENTNYIYSIVNLPSETIENSQFHGVKNYKYIDLQSATHDFSEEYRIGKGGYGEVFKVTDAP